MNTSNPTPIQVGMTGTFSGKAYRVAGRVVMSMDEGGETYFWNEFHLVHDTDDCATLVFEETEHGGQWRLFTLFDPEYAMSVEEAAAKRVGDTLYFDDTPMRVTLVDESRVRYIEGEAPEGVELGDIARYFNCEAGAKMIVVSWTGEEVEYYRGVDIPTALAASAFGLSAGQFKNDVPAGTYASALAIGNEKLPVTGAAARWFAILLLAVIPLITFIMLQSSRRGSPLVKTPAPDAALALGNAGTLDGKNYHVEGHVLMEIAETGRKYDRHEFNLSDDNDGKAILVCGLNPGARDWCLFTPLNPAEPMTPIQAAAVRWGETVNISGFVAPSRTLFQSSVLQSEQLSAADDRKPGNMWYGFTASGPATLLARWNQAGIQFYRGEPLPAKTVTSAFK